MAILPTTPDNPNATGHYPEPGSDPKASRDPGVALQQTPSRENRIPIVVAAADQRQPQRAGIGHIPRDVQPVFEKPDAPGGETQRLPLAVERNGQNNRKNQLPNCASVGFKAGGQQSDNRVSGL